MFQFDLAFIDSRIKAIEVSYHRQLGLAGKPGYDLSLTMDLKKDLDWLIEQRKSFKGSPQGIFTPIDLD